MIKLSEIKIIPISESIVHAKIPDELYFGASYADYISNSRLRYINPQQNGSPRLYLEGNKDLNTNYTNLGSAIHQLFLEKEAYTLDDSIDKPTAKLGKVIDKIRKYRYENSLSIHQAIDCSCSEIDYFAGGLSKQRIKTLIAKGLKYYLTLRELPENTIVLPRKDACKCKRCLEALTSHDAVMRIVEAENYEPDARSFNEDVLLMEVRATYRNEKETTLKLKMKADNWSIHPRSKKLVVNDLKTTSKPLRQFMSHFGSFYHYHYYRQMAMYAWMLQQFCEREYGYSSASWTTESNMVVVETSHGHQASCFKVEEGAMEMGLYEFFKLLKMVAYYEMFGYERTEVFG